MIKYEILMNIIKKIQKIQCITTILQIYCKKNFKNINFLNKLKKNTRKIEVIFNYLFFLRSEKSL